MHDVSYILVCFRNDRQDIERLARDLNAGSKLAGLSAEIQLVLNDPVPAVDWRCGVWSLISGQGNVGFAKGVTLGVRASSATHVVIVNPDCEVSPETIATFLGSLYECQGLVVPRLVRADGKVDFYAYENWTYGPGRKIAEWRCRRFFARSIESSVQLPRYAKAPGAFVGLSRHLAMRLDCPFDSRFFLYAEDRDLSNRARKMGVPIMIVPIDITHIGGVSGRELSDFISYCQMDGSLRVALRRFGRVGALLCALDVVFLDLIRARRLRTSTCGIIGRWARCGFGDPGRLTDADALGAVSRVSL